MAKKRILAPEASVGLKSAQLGEAAPSAMDVTSPAHERALTRAELAGKFQTMTDQLAESTTWFRNWKWEGSDKHFPDSIHALQRFVTKYYPYAKGGPLLIDEPRNPDQHRLAIEKQKLLRTLGFRHIVLDPNTDFYEALAQLDPAYWIIPTAPTEPSVVTKEKKPVKKKPKKAA